MNPDFKRTIQVAEESQEKSKYPDVDRKTDRFHDPHIPRDNDDQVRALSMNDLLNVDVVINSLQKFDRLGKKL